MNRNAGIGVVIGLVAVAIVIAVVLPRLTPQANANAVGAVSSAVAITDTAVSTASVVANQTESVETTALSSTSTRPPIGLTPVDPTLVSQPFETPVYTITPSRATFDVSSREAVLKIWSKIPSRLGDMDASFGRPLEDLSSDQAVVALSTNNHSLGVLILLDSGVHSGYLTFQRSLYLSGYETTLVPLCDHAYINKRANTMAIMVCANATFLFRREPTSGIDDSEVEALLLPVLYDLSVLFS